MQTLVHKIFATMVISTLVSSSYCSLAGAYGNENLSSFSQVTLIAGRPDFRLDFVRFSVVDGYSFIQFPEIDMSTQQLSILSSQDLHRVSMAEVVDQNGTTSFDLIARAIQFGVTRSPVITLSVGGDSRANNNLCTLMSRYPQTAFVISVGRQGTRIDQRFEPSCDASNILRTAGLNETQDDLTLSSNFGDTVRIAAPSVNIPSTGIAGRLTYLSGNNAAAMIVARELALFAESNPELNGSALVDQFFIDHTLHLPALTGKVEDARALINFNR